MTCSLAREMLGPHFDGELDSSAELQIRLHLADCGGCTAELERLQMRRRMIRSGGLSYQAPPGLEARIRKSLASGRPALSGWGSWLALAATLLLVSTISIRLVQLRNGAANLVAEEVVSSHVRALLSGHATDVISTDSHTVKPWFNGRIDFSPPVIDLAGQGFPLIGGRVDYVGHRSVAALVYGRRKHIIDLYVWPSQSNISGDKSLNGYNVVRWNKDGMFFLAVSDLNNLELQQFRDLLKK
jgi:anti-sigma factor RsiW